MHDESDKFEHLCQILSNGKYTSRGYKNRRIYKIYNKDHRQMMKQDDMVIHSKLFVLYSRVSNAKTDSHLLAQTAHDDGFLGIA